MLDILFDHLMLKPLLHPKDILEYCKMREQSQQQLQLYNNYKKIYIKISVTQLEKVK